MVAATLLPLALAALVIRLGSLDGDASSSGLGELHDVAARSLGAPGPADAPATPDARVTAAATVVNEATATPASGAAAATQRLVKPVTASAASAAEAVAEPAAQAAPRVVTDALRPNEALSSALARHGVSANAVSSLVRDLKGSIDVRSLRVGLSFQLAFDRATAGELQTFKVRTLAPTGVPRDLVAVRVDPSITTPDDGQGPHFRIDATDASIVTTVEGISGRVGGSLYQAMLAAGEDANLVNKFVDVFAWNIDFYRQTQRGDEFRVLVEKRYAGEGDARRFMGYGRVLAAEYQNAGRISRGFLFESKDRHHSGFYDDHGEALQRTFLKNPMEVSHITSSFGMRFHPVLGHNKKHEGIDYGAPIGTPVWSVADGVVAAARFSSTAGNKVTVRHMNGIETEYFHFSRFAEGVHAGMRVKQKQLIGYVGTTGLSTGPHLHFGMKRGGAHVDPSKQKFRNGAGVPHAYRTEFDALVTPLLAELSALGRV